jgi:hypothetical protein
MNTWTPEQVLEYCKDNGLKAGIEVQRGIKRVAISIEEQRIYYPFFMRLMGHNLAFTINKGALYISLRLGLDEFTFGWSVKEGWNEK